MKVKITYEFDAKYDIERPCWALSSSTVANGKTFADARERLMAKLQTHSLEPIPPEEEIEI